MINKLPREYQACFRMMNRAKDAYEKEESPENRKQLIFIMGNTLLLAMGLKKSEAEEDKLFCEEFFKYIHQ